MDEEKIKLIIKNIELLLSSLKEELLGENYNNTKFIENFESTSPPVDDFDEVFDY